LARFEVTEPTDNKDSKIIEINPAIFGGVGAFALDAWPAACKLPLSKKGQSTQARAIVG